MKTGKAFAAGVAGGIVMVILMWMARTFMGMPINLSMMEGTLFLPMGATAWIVGFIGVVGAKYGPVEHPADLTANRTAYA